MTSSDVQQQLLAVLDDATHAAARVQAADLARPTPCAEWDLGALLAHVAGQWQGFARALRDGDAPADAFSPIPFNQTDFAAARDELAAAVRRLDPFAEVVIADFGPQPVPAAGAVSAQLLDTAVHTWDVATALGRPYRPRADIVAAVSGIAEGIDESASTGTGAPFAPPVTDSDLDGAADPWRWTLARVGRETAAGA